MLRRKCEPIAPDYPDVKKLAEDMFLTLEEAEGVGLAAPQIGILRRVCIVLNDQEEYLELVNPEIVSQEGEQEGFEGCLSLTGMYGIVERPMKVKVKAQNRHGEPVEFEGEGITARCFCHEIEHLDGHLFVERTDHLLTEEELEEYIQQEEGDDEE